MAQEQKCLPCISEALDLIPNPFSTTRCDLLVNSQVPPVVATQNGYIKKGK